MESIVRQLKASLPRGLQAVAPDSRVVLVQHDEPGLFWSEFIGALEGGSSVALLDPSWPNDWKEKLSRVAMTVSDEAHPCILVPTSGSTGMPKFCIHTADTLLAAAHGFQDLGSIPSIPHAVNVLPQRHIGGMMPVFRSAIVGGLVHFADYRDSESMGSAHFNMEEASISLVPTQLRRMQSNPGMVDLLKRFALILIGGAACPRDLLDWAHSERLRLAPCYGSTETAAMVTMLSPESFLKGKEGVGSCLPHADIHIQETGQVAVSAESLFKGYHPEGDVTSRAPFLTGDIGELDKDGHLHIAGRADRVIISGGKNVHPELVENAAMVTGLLATAECRGIADVDWGQRIELWVRPIDPAQPITQQLEAQLKDALPSYARPKRIHLEPDL